MFLDQKDLKSNFLQKKNKEKKKIQQNLQQNTNVTKVQKNIRSFMMRKKLQRQLIQSGQVLSLILLNNNLDIIPTQRLVQTKNMLLSKLAQSFQLSQRKVAIFYLTKLFLSLISNHQRCQIAYQLLEESLSNNKFTEFVQSLIKTPQFLTVLNSQISQNDGAKLLNRSIVALENQGLVSQLKKKQLYETLLKEFNPIKMQIENMHSQKLRIQTVVICLNSLYSADYSSQPKFQDFDSISHLTHTIINAPKDFDTEKFPLQHSLAYLISNLLSCIQQQSKSLIKQISLQYTQIFNMMQDEEDLLYFENKILSHEKMEGFSSNVLKIMQEIFQSQKIVKMFLDKERQESKLIKDVMIKAIGMLGQMFEDRKIIFLRSLLSSNELLIELFKNKQPQLYEGLKMKLLAMDDEQFKSFDLFTQNQWKEIIHKAISESLLIIKQDISTQANKKKKLIPFESKNKQAMALTNFSQTLESLYKKCLRTKKFSTQIFISKDLTKAFYTFTFGTGALALEKMLKLYPYAFTFESRLQKFKQLIKEDKLKHDRTLFLQQEVDDDLIVHVRRGKQFLDAYHSLMHKDLRKKYKLVFFNEQGLEEEGIDGGGLIKEFINRVLKSAFSQVYGLFYETSQNQLLPNQNSPSTQEYEFVGKIIGKAVYEAITIEQKFAEPFLNLVIGRKNSFQDIQYIDPQIYKSLIQIKNMKDEDLQDLQQTFIILDQEPNGQKKYVNLLCPSKPVKGTQDEHIFVTRQNKLQFIMSYSDFKCNKQLQEKTRSFRKGFLKVLKPEWLTLFNNQELNMIISGGSPNFDVNDLKQNCVYTDYHEKSVTIKYFWEILDEFSAQQKSQFLLYVTSCSRPPTLGFGSMKPKLCISRDENANHLPSANTCMNVFRLPDYKDKETMRKKILYAIYSKAGFQFA